MSQHSFDFQDLLQLVELMKSTSQFSEFRLRANGIELELRRGPAGVAAVSAPVDPPVPVTQAASAPLPVPGGSPSGAAARPRGDAAAESRDAVTAPMVGTVYLAPEPGARPFVEIGQSVEADTQVCIVEVMKLMNSIVAGRKGVVSDILVADGEAVEYGQPLFVIRPA
jgi:acetyl-CoA carboxylase biotin carboxyl carrier protein